MYRQCHWSVQFLFAAHFSFDLEHFETLLDECSDVEDIGSVEENYEGMMIII